jgi:hypothetical protein
MAAPKNLPKWFWPWTLARFGLGLRPHGPGIPTHITTKELQWVLDEWAKYIIWENWVKMGKRGERPAILWRNADGRAVSPAWAGRLFKMRNHAPAPPPPPPPVENFRIINGASKGKNGLYCYNADIEKAIHQCKAFGLSYIAILVNETNLTPYRDGRRPKGEIFAEIEQIKQSGLICIATGWAEPYADLGAQAAFIGEMAAPADEYMLNIEVGWTLDAGVEPFGKSDIFAPLVRDRLGNKPLSLCPDWGNNIHWHPWLVAGMFAVRWQCYLNQWPHKSPKRAITELSDRAQHDLPQGLPKNVSREVVYGKYGGYMEPLSNWTPQDDEAGKPPRSDWASEFNTDEDSIWLSR